MTRRQIWIDLLLYPGHTLPTAAAPVLVAAGLAAHDRVFAAGPLLAAFVASWAIHVAGVFADNLELISRYPDIPEHPELLDALRSGALSVAGLRLAIAACLVVALAVAPYLAGVVGFRTVLLLGVVGVAASVGYAAGPLPYARLGLADPVFFLMFGLVAVPGAYLVNASTQPDPSMMNVLETLGALPHYVYVAGLPVAALVTNVLLIDEIRDVDFDRGKGWHGGAVRWGRGWSRIEIWALTAFAYAVPFAIWRTFDFTCWVLLPLVTVPAAVAIAWRVSRSDQLRALFPMTPRASSLAATYAALLAIGLAIR